ncbi:MAG: hypothetical protein WKF37_08565 [Bryobacteraceae bacterium]
MNRKWILAVTVCSAMLAADSAVMQARKKIADKKYDEAITQLETQLKAKAEPDAKKALSEAYLGKADSYMYNESLPPREKYPPALRAYREALKHDKTNKKAEAGIASIEGVYKQMGRPIPQ